MKQFLFLTMLCAMFATAIHAQQTSITIVNNNPTLDVYFRVGGDVSGGSCSYTYFSNVITLGAMSSVTYTDPATVPGGVNCGTCSPTTLSSTDFFYAIEILHNNAACGGAPTIHLGEPCGFGSTHGNFHVEDASCTPVGFIPLVTYDTGTATLTFN